MNNLMQWESGEYEHTIYSFDCYMKYQQHAWVAKNNGKYSVEVPDLQPSDDSSDTRQVGIFDTLEKAKQVAEAHADFYIYI